MAAGVVLAQAQRRSRERGGSGCAASDVPAVFCPVIYSAHFLSLSTRMKAAMDLNGTIQKKEKSRKE